MSAVECEVMEELRNGNWRAALDFIAQGADPNARTSVGSTILMEAAGRGCADVVAALLDAGADANARDSVTDSTALMYAAGHGHEDAVVQLARRGADVNARSRYGWTALTSAVSEGHGGIVAALVRHGARVSKQDAPLRMALDAAGENRNGGMAVLLDRAAAAQKAAIASRIDRGTAHPLRVGPPLKLKKPGGPA